MIYRKDNWTAQLNKTLEAKEDMPFEWGYNDCFLFACDCVKAITGFDPAKGYRGRYKTAGEAYRLMDSLGGMEMVMDDFLKPIGAFRGNPRLLARGDVAMIRLVNGRTALGIYVGRGVACAGTTCMEIAPVSAIVSAWGIV